MRDLPCPVNKNSVIGTHAGIDHANVGRDEADLLEEDGSASGDDDFFSVARTIPLVALIPIAVTPWLTAFRAYSICTSLPLGEKVVSEKE